MSKIALSGNASGTGTFTIASPNSNTDRTLNLPDNSGTVLTTGSTGAVTDTMLATAVQPIGVGQTWQNLTASRVANTTYTNTTGRPIQIAVCASTSIQFEIFEMVINGNSILFGRGYFSGSSAFAAITATIPNNATYRLATGNINNWLELR